MKSFLLILRVIIGPPETGPAHDFVLDTGLSADDCAEALKQTQRIWLGNDAVGMRCEPGVPAPRR